MKIKEIYEKETGFEAWSFDNKPSKKYTKWLENKLEAINYTRCCKELVCNYCLEKTDKLPDGFGCKSCIDNYK